MITRAAITSATTALTGSRALVGAMSVAAVANHATGRIRTATSAWYPAITHVAIFADSKHRRRPEEASQH